jgi:hypothetical protein
MARAAASIRSHSATFATAIGRLFAATEKPAVVAVTRRFQARGKAAKG